MTEPELDDARLREEYRHAVEMRGTTPRRRGCPGPDALAALVRREGPEEDRLRTLDHAMSCPDCRRELELLRSIERAGARDAGAKDAGVTGRVGQRPRWRSLVPLALAASLLLALSLGPRWSLWNGARAPVARGDAASVVLLAPATATNASVGDSLVFVWRPMPGARRYTLEVVATDGASAIEREATDTALAVAPAAAPVAGEYRWWVTAQAADGSVVRSEVRALTLRAP